MKFIKLKFQALLVKKFLTEPRFLEKKSRAGFKIQPSGYQLGFKKYYRIHQRTNDPKKPFSARNKQFSTGYNSEASKYEARRNNFKLRK